MLKQLLFSLLLFCTISTVSAQDEKIPERKKEDEEKLIKVNLAAHFPGNESAWPRFVERNLDMNAILSAIPDSVKELTDSIRVKFIVTKKGEITEPHVIGVNQSYYEQAVLSLLKKSPAWQPEIQGSGPVKAYVQYRFYFQITGDFSSVSVKRIFSGEE